MRSSVPGSGTASMRWLALDWARIQEDAEIVGVDRRAAATRLRLADAPEVLAGEYYARYHRRIDAEMLAQVLEASLHALPPCASPAWAVAGLLSEHTAPTGPGVQ